MPPATRPPRSGGARRKSGRVILFPALPGALAASLERDAARLDDVAARLEGIAFRAASLVHGTGWQARAEAAYRRDAESWLGDVRTLLHAVVDLRDDLAVAGRVAEGEW
jgi:hypothetical protein